MQGVSYEFEPQARVLHSSTAELVHINTVAAADAKAALLKSVLVHLGPEPVYLLINLAGYSIAPDMAAVYAKKIVRTVEKYIYPKGIVRYGMNLTRVTVKLAHDRNLQTDPNLFSNRSDAEAYLDQLIADRTGRSANEVHLERSGCLWQPIDVTSLADH